MYHQLSIFIIDIAACQVGMEEDFLIFLFTAFPTRSSFVLTCSMPVARSESVVWDSFRFISWCPRTAPSIDVSRASTVAREMKMSLMVRLSHVGWTKHKSTRTQTRTHPMETCSQRGRKVARACASPTMDAESRPREAM